MWKINKWHGIGLFNKNWMKMLAMRRENDQIFGSTNSNAINNNAISATNDTVADNCCSSNGYQDGKSTWNSWIFVFFHPRKS